MLRALVVSNMLAGDEHPERGSFVRDQVRALREIDDVAVALHEFPGGPAALARCAAQLRRMHRGDHFDVVHAHFGLSAWPALAVGCRVRALTLHGTDVSHPATRQATRLVLPFMDLVGAASAGLVPQVPGARARRRAQVLPCGVDTDRFHPMPRSAARAALGLEPQRPYLLFPADPARPEKRHDLARSVAGEATLLTLGGVAPDDVPLWVNAANAVLVPSEREGFGLAVLEALACDVPVLATPVGIHAAALAAIPGTLCAPFELTTWREAAAAHLRAADPRVAGRARAEEFSMRVMAMRVVEAWRAAVACAH